MNALLAILAQIAPLYLLIVVGFAVVKPFPQMRRLSVILVRFVFAFALPATLFQLMLGIAHLPPVDARLLFAFFGGCLLVFAVGRIVGKLAFGMDGRAQTVFAMGGVFSNNLLLGVPLAQTLLGAAAMPSVGLVLAFNSLILWTLLTVSIEWAQHGQLSLPGLAKMAWRLSRNPILIGIAAGWGCSYAGVVLPAPAAVALGVVATLTLPIALVALGAGLAEFGASGDAGDWRISWSITGLKLVLQPLTVWGLAVLLGLPPVETDAIVLMASIAVGANVFLMSRQFGVLERPVANSLVLTTGLSALTSPLCVLLLRRVGEG